MATVLIKATKCDICEAPDAQLYFFQMPDATKHEVDLCDKHAAPLVGLLKFARAGKPRRAKRGDGIVVSAPAPRQRTEQAAPKKRTRTKTA